MATPAQPVIDPLAAEQAQKEHAAMLEKLNKRLDDKWRIAILGRPYREARWFRNCRFQSGEHWIYINPTSYRVEPRPLPTPDFPRAVTNKYAKINSDLIFSYIGQAVPLNPRPSTDNPDDKASAEIADLFAPAIEDEAGWEELEEPLATWLTLTGNAFLLPWYDYDEKWGTQQVDFLSCPQCGGEWPVGAPEVETGVCPNCAPAVPAAPDSPIGAAEGVTLEGSPIALQPIAKSFPIGRLRTDLCSPFEILFDNRLPLPEPRPWFFRRFRISEEDAKKKWPDFAGKISVGMPDFQSPSATDYLESLSFLGTRGIGSTGAEGKSINGVVYYEEPCADYPNGLCVTRLGKSLIVEFDELKTAIGAGVRKGTRFLGLIHFYGDVLAGSAWGKPRADDLVHMQVRRNIIEGALTLTAQRTGTPKLLNPENSGIKNVVGAAGQMLTYRPYLLGTSAIAEPKYLEAALGNVGPLVTFLQMIDEAMESLAGTNFLTGGDAPSGVTAASALALLDERAVRSISPLKRKWARGKRNWLLMCLEIIRQHWKDDRFLAVAGRNKQWQVEKFKGADFAGSIDVRVDYEALMPKSKAREAADVQLLTQLHAIDPLDPETSYAVLEIFGMTKLKGAIDLALAQAEREWDKFINEGIPPKLLPGLQNSPVHLMQHRRDAQTQEFEALLESNPQQAQVWIDHIHATMVDIQAAMLSGMAPAPAEGSSQVGALVGASGPEGGMSPEQKGRGAVAANRGEEPPADAEPPMTGANARR